MIFFYPECITADSVFFSYFLCFYCFFNIFLLFVSPLFSARSRTLPLRFSTQDHTNILYYWRKPVVTTVLQIISQSMDILLLDQDEISFVKLFFSFNCT